MMLPPIEYVNRLNARNLGDVTLIEAAKGASRA